MENPYVWKYDFNMVIMSVTIILPIKFDGIICNSLKRGILEKMQSTELNGLKESL